MRVLLLVNELRRVGPSWTTTHLAHAASAKGLQVGMLEPADLEITREGRLVARVWMLDGTEESPDALAARFLQRNLTRRYVEFHHGDLLLLRINPYDSITMALAEVAIAQGAAVFNEPAGIQRTRTKAWLATLRDVPHPSTTITRSPATAERFAASWREVIVKPASGSGGARVLKLRGRDGRAIQDAVRANSWELDLPSVVQEYLPAASAGEKRIFWVAGHGIGVYLRQRADGDFRHNLKAGAAPVATTLQPSDHRILEAIGPHLLRNGIRIAGLDVIGERLVEVNTLNPGGVHWADALGDAPAGRLAERALDLLLREAAIPAAIKDDQATRGS